jgi:hypothetical protein
MKDIISGEGGLQVVNRFRVRLVQILSAFRFVLFRDNRTDLGATVGHEHTDHQSLAAGSGILALTRLEAMGVPG